MVVLMAMLILVVATVVLLMVLIFSFVMGVLMAMLILVVAGVLSLVAPILMAMLVRVMVVMCILVMVTVVLVIAVLSVYCTGSNRGKFHFRMHRYLADSACPVHDCAANDGRFPSEIHLEHDHFAARTGFAVGVIVAGFILMTVLVMWGGFFIDKEEPFSFEGKKARLWSHPYVIELCLQGECREFIHVELLRCRVGDDELSIVSGKSR